MAKYDLMSALTGGLEGADEGIDNGLRRKQSMLNMQIARQGMDQKNKEFDVEYKRKKLDLELAEMRNEATPAQLSLEKESLEYQNKKRKADYNLAVAKQKKFMEELQQEDLIQERVVAYLEENGYNADNIGIKTKIGGSTVQIGKVNSAKMPNRKDVAGLAKELWQGTQEIDALTGNYPLPSYDDIQPFMSRAEELLGVGQVQESAGEEGAWWLE